MASKRRRDSNPKGRERKGGMSCGYSGSERPEPTAKGDEGRRMRSIRKSPSWRANKKISRQRDFFIGKQKEERTRTRKGASEKAECPEDIPAASGPSRPKREAKGGG